ncbi:MAG: hypothetical protein L0332_22480 [Chloroflexi bacterium]|nr:hypothetical protein [Chloroflexota bacterium]MCI0578306.1 hypothetical protein [Chloroflexota bacterium]MCI0649026.1 hypothetical protein [Chloroflexota bacterium]MCI0729461.1 hypothetical protein [Chloroflexota bacterium]
MSENPFYRRQADQHFDQARRRAAWEKMSAWLAGQDQSLLPFEAIRAELKQQHPLYRGVRQIPLANIVGSMGRYQDFTRSFLPLNDSMRERWVKVESLAIAHGWLPIEVYQVGDVYFVRDGNHRVAIAHQMGYDTIEAHVWEFPGEIPIGPQDSLDEVLLRLGERNFLDKTHLDQLRPDHSILFTLPGQYTELLAQIRDLREKLALIDGREIPYEEAVEGWYEMIYLPTVLIIRESGLLDDFPGRTEADLFVWLSLNREQLSQLYGDGSLEEWAAVLASRHKEGGLKRVARQVRRLLGRQEPPPLEGL